MLAVRTMLESAANLAYLRANIVKTYASELSRKDMTYLSFRMRFATRKPDDMELSADEASCTSSVNVLTAIKALDRFATAELGFANEKAMTNWYERLCELRTRTTWGTVSAANRTDLAEWRHLTQNRVCVPRFLSSSAIMPMFRCTPSVVSTTTLGGCWWSTARCFQPGSPPGDPVILLD